MPLDESTIKCSKCGYENKRTDIRCKRCAESLGAPNVNIIDIDSEKNALEQRYQEAKAKCPSDKCRETFEQAITDKSKAVVNLYFKYLGKFVFDMEPYLSYHLQVDQDKREIAEWNNHRKRGMIDAYLFGLQLAPQIVYAALSLNGEGLTNYGNVTITLDTEAIKHRVSLLEENAYNFAMKDNRLLEDEIPRGFRCIWADRSKLTVAKHYADLTDTLHENDFPDVILQQGTDRKTDVFIEVHIYDKVYSPAFKHVKVKSVKTTDDRLKELTELKEIKKLEKILGTRLEVV